MKTQTLKNKTLKVIFILAVVLYGTLLVNVLEAQSGTINKQKMEALANWVGEWEGEGWSINEARQREEFTITERIQSRLDGMVFLIEGFGKDKTSGKPVHTALATLYFNNEAGRYEMKSFIEKGMTTLADASIEEDGSFVWGFDVPGGRIRYTTVLTATTWQEKGEFVMASGQAFPILEMNLKRLK